MQKKGGAAAAVSALIVFTRRQTASRSRKMVPCLNNLRPRFTSEELQQFDIIAPVISNGRVRGVGITLVGFVNDSDPQPE
jgi:hypothetical protein